MSTTTRNNLKVFSIELWSKVMQPITFLDVSHSAFKFSFGSDDCVLFDNFIQMEISKQNLKVIKNKKNVFCNYNCFGVNSSITRISKRIRMFIIAGIVVEITENIWVFC